MGRFLALLVPGVCLTEPEMLHEMAVQELSVCAGGIEQTGRLVVIYCDDNDRFVIMFKASQDYFCVMETGEGWHDPRSTQQAESAP